MPSPANKTANRSSMGESRLCGLVHKDWDIDIENIWWTCT